MSPSSRIPAMDVLRGCAVMGILWMNITAFAQPQSAYINPAAAGPLTTGDIAFWAISLILVDGKMRGLFAMLFGAGIGIGLLTYSARELRTLTTRLAVIRSDFPDAKRQIGVISLKRHAPSEPQALFLQKLTATLARSA